MSNLRKTLPPKLPAGTLIFIPGTERNQTAGIIINEPTSHFTRNSIEAFYVYDVFITTPRPSGEDGKVVVVASSAIQESFEA